MSNRFEDEFQNDQELFDPEFELDNFDISKISEKPKNFSARELLNGFIRKMAESREPRDLGYPLTKFR